MLTHLSSHTAHIPCRLVAQASTTTSDQTAVVPTTAKGLPGPPKGRPEKQTWQDEEPCVARGSGASTVPRAGADRHPEVQAG